MQHEKFVAASAIAVAVTLSAIFWLRPLARRFGLVDRPSTRKRHRGQVPLIGGLCFFVGMIAGLIYFGRFDPFSVSLLVSGAIVVLLGVLDDLYDLAPRTRLFIQAAAVVLVMAGTGVYIDSAGRLFGGEEFRLWWLGVPFTVVAVVGLVNAFNMLDGIDGLAGSLAMVSIASVLAFAGIGAPAAGGVLLMLEILAIALVPYLLVNLGWPDGRRIFMGDAGSMLIGFVLAWSLIHLSQRDHALAPADVLWCVALPVMDTLAVMYQRMRRGGSPFRADRQHLHHLLLDAGLSPRKALGLIVAAAGMLAALGYALRDLPEALSVAVFLSLLIAYVLQARRAAAWLRHAAEGRLPSALPQWVSDVIAACIRTSWVRLLLGKQTATPSAARVAPAAAERDGPGIGAVADRHQSSPRAHQARAHQADDDRVKALCVLDGTPEDLEMVPVVQQLMADARFDARICVAGQWDQGATVRDGHASLDRADAANGAAGEADRSHDDPPGADAPEVVSRVLGEMKRMFKAFKPDVVLVHGESPTVLATALVAYYREIPVARMEIDAFAEPDARRANDAADCGLVRTLASVHFTSTERTGDELIAAGIPQDRITVACRADAGSSEQARGPDHGRLPCGCRQQRAGAHALEPRLRTHRRSARAAAGRPALGRRIR